MKRILIACSMFLCTCGASFAQSAPSHPTPAPVSKTDFIAKVSELNTLITSGSTDAANIKWREISQMVNGELIIVRYKVQDATDAHNDADKTTYQNLSRSQRMLYAQVMQLKSDMVTNKAAINEKLSAFAAGMI